MEFSRGVSVQVGVAVDFYDGSKTQIITESHRTETDPSKLFVDFYIPPLGFSYGNFSVFHKERISFIKT